VIGGWIPGQGRRSGGLGSVIVGYHRGDKLISAGGVGTGFTNQMLVAMANRLGPLARPFSGGHVPREARFVEPQLVCEVEFTEWASRSGELRRPTFKGLRWDKAPAEMARAASTTPAIAAHYDLIVRAKSRH
jgi:bifunctional non-homologous end joining protein LigD